MALIKATKENIKQKLGAWKNTPPVADQIIFNVDDVQIDKNELIGLCFNNGFVIDVEGYYGKLNKIVYIGALI